MWGRERDRQRGRGPDLAGLLVAKIDDFRRRVRDRIVAPAREPVGLAVSRPREARAALGDEESEPGLATTLTQGAGGKRGCRLVPWPGWPSSWPESARLWSDQNAVFAAIGGESAQTVGEEQASGRRTGSSSQWPGASGHCAASGQWPDPFDPVDLTSERAPRAVEHNPCRGLEKLDRLLADPLPLDQMNAAGLASSSPEPASRTSSEICSSQVLALVRSLFAEENKVAVQAPARRKLCADQKLADKR